MKFYATYLKSKLKIKKNLIFIKEFFYKPETLIKIRKDIKIISSIKNNFFKSFFNKNSNFKSF